MRDLHSVSGWCVRTVQDCAQMWENCLVKKCKTGQGSFLVQIQVLIHPGGGGGCKLLYFFASAKEDGKPLRFVKLHSFTPLHNLTF